MNKNWIIGVVVLVVIIAGLSYWGFKNNVGKSADSIGPQISGASSSTVPSYYNNNAQVMEFYQDTCEWCIKEQPVMEKLGTEGYRFKPMNIGANHPENQSWWKDYKVSGTPTFIAKNGDRLEGYQEYDSLKAFLDKHK